MTDTTRDTLQDHDAPTVSVDVSGIMKEFVSRTDHEFSNYYDSLCRMAKHVATLRARLAALETVTDGVPTQLREAANSLSRLRVKTRDVGQCKQCLGYTSSGMNAYCDDCAVKTIGHFADVLEAALAARTPERL